MVIDTALTGKINKYLELCRVFTLTVRELTALKAEPEDAYADEVNQDQIAFSMAQWVLVSRGAFDRSLTALRRIAQNEKLQLSQKEKSVPTTFFVGCRL